MKSTFKTLAIAAVVASNIGFAQAEPECKKIAVPKKVNATIVFSLNCADQLKAAFPGYSDQYLSVAGFDGNQANVCYVSTPGQKIPGKIGGQAVELETVSAMLQGGTANSQLVLTLYRVSGAYNGEIYAIDNIHAQMGYEDELFFNGTGDFAESGGVGRLTYVPDNSAGLPFPGAITFTRLKGDICFGTAGS